MISNISAIVTCFTFVLYLIGRILKTIASRDMIFERFEVVPFSNDSDTYNFDNELIIDKSGSVFSISSNYGIRNLKVYRVTYEPDDNGTPVLISRELIETYGKININDKLYIWCDLGEVLPTIQIEVERMDYAKVTFELHESGKTGNIDTNYQFKMTFLCFLYYLCA